MNFQTALTAAQEALRVCNITLHPEKSKYSIYVNFTTKALTLRQKQIDHPAVSNLPYIRAKDGNPRNDFWIIGFTNFYEAFTVLIILWEILRCRYGEIFSLSVHNTAKPTPMFPF